ncbi:MAG TPA: Gfo/Idh/MocA family oxidoreductase [Deltaproteobacteria bacterium]|jgi:predicted dehydrogenase|nr:Gfo/Idh/MocA family oxidoreductase [Deltaproteobacteria bacterium]
MNIAIIGARRANNGIGEYIGKYLKKNGAHVVCVLGTNEATARQASAALEHHGITARPYHDFTKMIASEKLDAVAIASPVQTHREYLLSALEDGLSVLCEKPFLDPGREKIGKELESLFEISRQKGTTVAMNSQWPFCLPFYDELCGYIHPYDIRSFFIRLSPLCSGSDMIPDSVPHGLSILYCALGKGEISGLSFGRGEHGMTVVFTYTTEHGDCRVSMSLIQEKVQPRTFSFGFNNLLVQRTIDMTSYDISLASGEKRIRIPDPLELSVRDFIDAHASGREPAVGEEHIRETTLLLKQIYDAYNQL